MTDTELWLAGLDQGLTADHKNCTDCFTRDHRRVLCPAHRCHGLNAKGERCRQRGNPARAYEFCDTHGCNYRYPGSYVLCMAHHAPGNNIYCAEHLEIRKAERDQKRALYVQERLSPGLSQAAKDKLVREAAEKHR